jgi:hypothetical protein
MELLTDSRYYKENIEDDPSMNKDCMTGTKKLALGMYTVLTYLWS